MADQGEIAPMELPATEFGVRRFQITENQYLNPAALFELMSGDPGIQRAGVFIGRLKESAETQSADEASVEQVKELLRVDPADRETGGKVFRPEVASIRDMWAEKNVLEIVGCSPADRRKKQYRNLKEEFRQQILGHNFSNAPTTELEMALSSGGVDGCLNTLFVILRNRDRKLMYAPNTCPADVFLQTTASCAMKNMKTNIENLPEGPHLGINVPSIYIGDEAATFNLHIEDHALESVNRHVAGKAKVWFFVPPRHSQSLYNLARDMGVSNQDRVCHVFIQHRHIFMDPRTILHEGIPVTTVIQKPGDVVYVLPNSHHWGFNVGKNINEAINCGSRAWVLPGMMSTGRCYCYSGVGSGFFDFKMERIFGELVENEEYIENYKEGRVHIFSDLLRRNVAALHPQTGRPFQEPLKPSELLGPDFSQLEIGKPWKAPLNENYNRHREFWGGCDLIELEDSEDETEMMDQEKQEKYQMQEEEEGEGDDAELQKEEDEDEQLQGKAIGVIQCTEVNCTWSTNEKGTRGIEAAQRHVKGCHATTAPEVLKRIQRKYDADHRPFKTKRHFECHVCKKTKRGSDAHMERHLQSCLAKHDKVKQMPNKGRKKAVDKQQ